ncbi:MAG: hypothetical protein JSW25_00395 [Thermoplasmata archaeon]|nr:MAG: hypothetical protein JSW25_00395 [Thermoplasmata archaeon]
MTDYWLSDLAAAAHALGYIGMALMVFSMAYSLRKRKWLVRQGKMTWWLTWHHWAGFIGGVLALGHTLGNLTRLGTLIIALLLLVLGSSGLYFLERRSRRPLSEATSDLAKQRKERKRLDAEYRGLYAAGRSGTPQGQEAYRELMETHERVQTMEKEVAALKERGPSWTFWRHTHNIGTMMLVGVLLVHIWSKVYFGGLGL